MSSTSATPSTELELRLESFPDPPPPPADMYQYQRAGRVLKSITNPTPATETKIREALELVDDIHYTDYAVIHAYKDGDWFRVLGEIQSFEEVMRLRTSGSPGGGYRHPLPKLWLMLSCEALAFLGRVESAEQTLSQLVMSHELTYVEWTWLMGLIDYVSGNVSTSLELLRSIETRTDSAIVLFFLKRAEEVQEMLDVLENLDFFYIGDRIMFNQILDHFMLAGSYLLLDRRIKGYIHKLYKQKIDSALALQDLRLPVFEARERGCSWSQAAGSSRNRASSAPSIIETNSLFADPVPRSASTSALDSLRRKHLDAVTTCDSL